MRQFRLNIVHSFEKSFHWLSMQSIFLQKKQAHTCKKNVGILLKWSEFITELFTLMQTDVNGRSRQCSCPFVPFHRPIRDFPQTAAPTRSQVLYRVFKSDMKAQQIKQMHIEAPGRMLVNWTEKLKYKKLQ